MERLGCVSCEGSCLIFVLGERKTVMRKTLLDVIVAGVLEQVGDFTLGRARSSYGMIEVFYLTLQIIFIYMSK